MKDYVNSAALQEYTTKLVAKLKTLFPGTPTAAATVAEMTDHNKTYVYVGTESGYTAGDWYYWNGTAWTSGGPFQATSIITDTTLAVAGEAADAKATGDAIAAAKTAVLNAMAPAYSTSGTYAVGDYVNHNGAIYRCTTAITTGEAWTAGHWAAVTLGADLEDQVGALKESLKADELSENYVIIYDDSANIAGSSNWPARSFNKNVIKLNGSFSSTANDFYMRMDRPTVYGTSISSVNAWDKNIPLIADHTYKFSGFLLSGTATIPDGEPLTYNAKDSGNSIVLTCGYNESVLFKCQTTGNFLFYLQAQKNSVFADAVLAYTLVDITDEVTQTENIEELTDAVNELESANDENILNILKYLSANVFSKYATDYLPGKGYSGTTGNIVDSSNNIITGYIPVKKGDAIQCLVNGTNMLKERVDGQSRKIALYDSEKTWKKTETTAQGFGIEYYTAPYDGYVRFMLRKTDYIEIYVSSLTKKDKEVDLILFAGQSNMAGRGETSTAHPETAPAVIPGYGYEFRPISDPTKLYPITEPFGVAENDSSGIDDGNMKTGSLVSAFANSYYPNNGKVSLVGVSASKGGTSTASWLPSGAFFTDLTSRVAAARAFLADNGYSIRHQYVAWCQGESDGDNIANGTETLQQYKDNTLAIFGGFIALEFEKVLLVRIGKYNSGTGTRYDDIINWQTEVAQTNDNVVMISCDFAGMKDKGLMKDSFHYYQEGYNITGESAGVNAAIYASQEKEATMYNPMDNSLYYTHKN